MSGEGVATCIFPVDTTYVELYGSTLAIKRPEGGDCWEIRFVGLEPFATVQASATKEEVVAACLRFLVGIE